VGYCRDLQCRNATGPCDPGGKAEDKDVRAPQSYSRRSRAHCLEIVTPTVFAAGSCSITLSIAVSITTACPWATET
jgi:hypothetical protein